MVGGLINGVSGEIYENSPLKSVKSAFGRGVLAGGATAGINNLYNVYKNWKTAENGNRGDGLQSGYGWLDGYSYGLQDPKGACGTINPLMGLVSSSFRKAVGYAYKSMNQERQVKKKSGFDAKSFVTDVAIGSFIGGAGSVMFYGIDKEASALRGSIRGNKGGSDRYINGQRTSKYHKLTDTEIASLKNDIRDIRADESIFRFNEGYQTGYSDKKGLIYVKGDVLPDVTSTHPRDLMSSKAVLAHEYYGHKNFGDLYGSRNPLPGAWNDEFGASYNAALNAPNLSEMDRMYLMSDALEIAKAAGVSIKITDTIRILYGY